MKVTKHEPHKVLLSKTTELTLGIPHSTVFCLVCLPDTTASVVFSLCQLTLQSLSFYLLYSLAKTLFAQSFPRPVHI